MLNFAIEVALTLWLAVHKSVLNGVLHFSDVVSKIHKFGSLDKYGELPESPGATCNRDFTLSY